MKMILASNNAKKLRELKAILSDMGVELCSQREAGCDFEVEETGTTFAENAYLKAAAVVEATGGCQHRRRLRSDVDALNGERAFIPPATPPAGHDASDKEKYEYLLKKLEGVKDRDAKFVSSICCIFPNGDIIRCEGECAGKILLSPRGEGGFGYDPVFMPTGYDKSMAELGTEVKNEISHRANALKIFKKKLREYNGTDK